jgi:hypothetical protein
MQIQPRRVRVTDFSDILRVIYKPLFILEKLDPDFHVKESYKLLYRFLYIENPIEAKDKYQELIRSAMAAYVSIRKDIKYLLYPLLMKLISDRWLPYEMFFEERKNRLRAFLNVREEDRIMPPASLEVKKPVEKPSGDNAADNKDNGAEDKSGAAETEAAQGAAQGAAQEAAQEAARKSVAENKALERGLRTLESLFPRAGWNQLDAFPDLYPYFAKVFDLKKGYELLAPHDPLLQVTVLMHIISDLLLGLRSVSFEPVTDAAGEAEPLGEFFEALESNWHDYEIALSEDYLSRLVEYCGLLETSSESQHSNYARRIHNELRWLKRLTFLPYYHFDTVTTSPFKKSEVKPMFADVRRFRKYLTLAAAGIDKAVQQGGAEANAHCAGVTNPWAPYSFQLSNAVSWRLDMLLGKKKQNNASLIFFTLAVTTVLDHLINNEQSWAYEDNTYVIFRSINNVGERPQYGVDKKLDADAIFKQVMKEKRGQKP